MQTRADYLQDLVERTPYNEYGVPALRAVLSLADRVRSGMHDALAGQGITYEEYQTLATQRDVGAESLSPSQIAGEAYLALPRAVESLERLV